MLLLIQRFKLHGCNRHMSYPYIGNAVPKSGHYRDALRIKEFGFDFVRMSHYMQPESFVDACDNLGIASMACLPGWQYYSDSQDFRNNSIKVLRNTIRVYRNHPSVIVYESMHNESRPSNAFLKEAHAAAHEEYPGDQMFTCGEEENNVLDVYISSSQHGVKNYNGSRPCIISEYGDWEHGCVWSSNGPITGCRMRLDRSAGESALNAMRSTRANDLKLNEACSWFTADGIWTIFDYQSWDKMPYTGCGDMDIFRIPKYSSYAYQNQIPLVGELAISSSGIKVVIDTADLPFMADGSDVAIVYASNVNNNVTFSVSGPGSLVGNNPAEAISGIASILLRAGTSAGEITITAEGPEKGSAKVMSHPVAFFPDNGTSSGERAPRRRLQPILPADDFNLIRRGNALSAHIPDEMVSADSPLTLTLYNGQGRIVGKWKLKHTATVLTSCTFAKGIYLGRIESETNRVIRKVIW